jgi:hypothetical protein
MIISLPIKDVQVKHVVSAPCDGNKNLAKKKITLLMVTILHSYHL